MRKEIAEMWAAALRSDEYTQTTELLRDDTGHCCLGVLCDLHRRRTGDGEWSGSSYISAGSTDSGSETILPECVSEWAGCQSDPMDSETGEFFTRLNDYLDYSFVQLADLIEDQWENL
jgi:hypothetical protein